MPLFPVTKSQHAHASALLNPLPTSTFLPLKMVHLQPVPLRMPTFTTVPY
uniref:Uncharacterized protein n=1 Tax=Anguilla anguilla TaxID=7936 RepID=A0A0E9Q2D3_ANGAN